MTRHPTQFPAVAVPLRRGPGAVQFGVAPGSLVVSGLSDEEVRALCSWSRGAGRHSARLAPVLEQAATQVTTEVTGTVAVVGRGPLVDRLRGVLEQSGLTAQTTTLGPAGWVGLDPLSVVSSALPGLAILVDYFAVPAAAGRVWRDLGIPVLAVADHGSRVDVGPLVTVGSPCLECVERYRHDRDQAWLELSVELATGARPMPASCDPALSLGAGMAALVAIGHLSGRRWPTGLSLEVGLPDPDIVHRRWPVHSTCSARHMTEAAGA